MSSRRPFARALCLLILLALTSATLPGAAQADEPATISLADGKLQLRAPANWQRKKPASSIVEHEFAIPKAEGDENDGRLTIMAAGGGVDANVARWYGQFPGSKRDPAKDKKLKVGGLDVHLVDIAGTFKDSPRGPMGPTVERPKYRMLGAIIETKGQGNYFLKFYGPERTVTDNEKAFTTMVEGLEQK